MLLCEAISMATVATTDSGIAEYCNDDKWYLGQLHEDWQAILAELGPEGADKVHSQAINTSWEPVKQIIAESAKEVSINAVFHIGDHRGLLFRHGDEYLDRRIRIASEMKFVTAVLTLRLVELGMFRLDDKVNAWLDFWPTGKNDSRSSVTIRHCLAFTAGFSSEAPVANDSRSYELRCNQGSARDCAKQVVQKPHTSPPGTVWTYSNDNLLIVAAVIESASDTSFERLLIEQIYQRTRPPMTSTHPYRMDDSPDPGTHMWSTARDMQRFLDSYFNGHLISKGMSRELEADQLIDVERRVFLGMERKGRPYNTGTFGLGVWRADPLYQQEFANWCNTGSPCIYEPNHFDSVLVVSRPWQSKGVQCEWRYSSSCSFYFHMQILGKNATNKMFSMMKGLSHRITREVTRILNGSSGGL